LAALKISAVLTSSIQSSLQQLTLKDHPHIIFACIGGYQDRSLLKYSLGVPDADWISPKPQLEGLIVPSKFYGIVAAGRPIIAITAKDGEIAHPRHSDSNGPSKLVPYVQLRYARMQGSAPLFVLKMEEAMTRLMLASLITALAIGCAAAQAPETCESKAIGKDGKQLAGAAKNSFMAKCKREACEPKAIGLDGKPLKGAAKNSFMAKCQREQA
jgi:hypothetical protein